MTAKKTRQEKHTAEKTANKPATETGRTITNAKTSITTIQKKKKKMKCGAKSRNRAAYLIAADARKKKKQL